MILYPFGNYPFEKYFDKIKGITHYNKENENECWAIDEKEFDLMELKEYVEKEYLVEFTEFEKNYIATRECIPMRVTFNELSSYVKKKGYNSNQLFILIADAYNCYQKNDSILFNVAFYAEDEEKIKIVKANAIAYFEDIIKNDNNIDNIQSLEDSLVRITGYIDFYSEKFILQIKATQVEILGESRRKQNFNKILKQYENQSSQKIPTGFKISKIGLITKSHSRAYEDFYNFLSDGLKKMVELKDVTLSHDDEVAEAIRDLNKNPKDGHLIVIVRGGGDPYDLYRFSQSTILDAVAKSQIPIITGIGHFKDESVCDKIASYNARTPTGAAKYINRLFYQEKTEKNDKIKTQLQKIIKKQEKINRAVKYLNMSNKILCSHINSLKIYNDSINNLIKELDDLI